MHQPSITLGDSVRVKSDVGGGEAGKGASKDGFGCADILVPQQEHTTTPPFTTADSASNSSIDTASPSNANTSLNNPAVNDGTSHDESANLSFSRKKGNVKAKTTRCYKRGVDKQGDSRDSKIIAGKLGSVSSTLCKWCLKAQARN